MPPLPIFIPAVDRALLEPHRGSITQPGVARTSGLPRVAVNNSINPERVAALARASVTRAVLMQPLWGWIFFLPLTQGSSSDSQPWAERWNPVGIFCHAAIGFPTLRLCVSAVPVTHP